MRDLRTRDCLQIASSGYDVSFGWIDGVRKSLGEESYVIRFTPRRLESIWNAVNVRRAKELVRLGVMAPPGLKTFIAPYPRKTNRCSFEQLHVKLGGEYEKRFRANRRAWKYFQSCPSGYRKFATWWVVSAKKEATRLKRHGTLIADSAAGRIIGPLGRQHQRAATRLLAEGQPGRLAAAAPGYWSFRPFDNSLR